MRLEGKVGTEEEGRHRDRCGIGRECGNRGRREDIDVVGLVSLSDCGVVVSGHRSGHTPLFFSFFCFLFFVQSIVRLKKVV